MNAVDQLGDIMALLSFPAAVLGGVGWITWGLWNPWRKKAEEVNTLEGHYSSRRASRIKSRNEWLLMWYNALPETEKLVAEQRWAGYILDAAHRMFSVSDVAEYEREKTRWDLQHAEVSVNAVLNPPEEVAVLEEVKHVRADSIRTASMLDGPTAVGCQTSLAEAQRWKDVRRQWAQTHSWPEAIEPDRRRIRAKVVSKFDCSCSDCFDTFY